MRSRIALTTIAAMALFVLHPSPSFAAAPKVPAFVAAAVADPHRPKSDTNRDADRLPAIMLGFSGVKPGDTVAELIPAQGYATRLLSVAVGPKGYVSSINLSTLSDAIKNQ